MTTAPEKRPAQITSAPDWREIFKKRPDLNPPGYQETVDAIRAEKETSPQ